MLGGQVQVHVYVRGRYMLGDRYMLGGQVYVRGTGIC